MNLDDIRRVIELSAEHSLRVSVRLVPEMPGYVQTICLNQGNVARIEYEVYGMDEGGAYYEATYTSLDDAVVALEQFTGKTRDQWPDNQLSRETVKRPSADEVQRGHEALQQAITAGAVPLPSGASFLLESSYWKQFERKVLPSPDRQE